MIVLVTGAGGFIAKHLIHYLLDEHYEVLGTVRSEEEGIHIVNQFDDPNLFFEIVPEIADSEVIDKLFAKHKDEIKVVIHLASPLMHASSNYEETMMKPAIDGTRNILSGCFKCNVDKLVITSSALTMMDFSKMSDDETMFSENDWNPVTRNNYGRVPAVAYTVAKKYAELEAWKFVRNKDVRFGLCTICPTHVFGPRLFDEDFYDLLNVANKPIDDLIHSVPGHLLERCLHSEFVDVRDVARAHMLAFQCDCTEGQRLAVSAGKFRTEDIVEILKHAFPKLGETIAQIPSNRQRVAGECSGASLNTRQSNDILGITYRSLEETIYDLTKQILRAEAIL